MWIITILLYLIWAIPMQWAWNFVMPVIFGLPKISYWQMWAMLALLTTLWKPNVSTVLDFSRKD